MSGSSLTPLIHCTACLMFLSAPRRQSASLELLHHTPSSLNQPLNKCQTIIRQGSLGTLKVLGLPKHTSCLQCTSMPLMPLGTGRLGPQSNPVPDNRFLLSHGPEAFVQQTRWCLTLCLNLEAYLQQSQRLLMSERNVDYFFPRKPIWFLSGWFALAFVGSAAERFVDRVHQTELSCRGALRDPLWCVGTLRWTCVLY